MAENGILDYQGMNQAIYRGATSNIVVDTQGMSIEIGAGNASHTSNLHIECDHDANVASIKLNSNVVTEFPRSKKLIRYPRVALTSAAGESSGYQGYYVTESSNSTQYPARVSWKAFNMTFSNADTDDTWTPDQGTNYDGTDYTYNPSADNPVKNLGTGAVDGEWIKLQLPHKIRLEYMKIWLKDNDPTRIPEDWKLYGSDDNTNWTELFSKIGQGAILENTYNVNARSMYQYFAVVVTKISGQNNYFRINELEYFGTPEYDPDADGVDVTIKSVPNVPNTDWLEVYYDAKDLADGAVTSVSDLKPSSLGTALNSSSTNNITVSDDAFVFNGIDSYIKIDDLTNPSGAWTHSVVAWINSSDLGNFDLTWIGDVDSATTRQSFSFHTSGQALTMGISASNVQFSFSSPLVKGKWHHVVYTFSGGAAGSGSTAYKVFVDGVEGDKTGGVGGGTLNLPAQTAIWIGRNPGGANYFKGKIANFRLFNRPLTQDEIWQLYAYQKEYFGHGDLGMTLKAGRLGIGTSEPRAALDVRGSLNFGIPNVHSDSLSGSGSISAATEEAGYAPLGNDMYVVWGNHAIAHTGSGQYNWTWYFPNDFTMTVLSAVGTLRDCGYGYSYDRSGLGINGYYTNRISGHTKNDTIRSFTQHIHFVIIGKKV